MSVLDDAMQVAKALVKIAPHVAELTEDIVELRKRQGRDAEVGDLEDSVKKLRDLDRRQG